MDKTTENRIVTDAYSKYNLPSEGGQRIGYQEGATAENERAQPAIDALTELIELKRMKDELGKTTNYLTRQPEAWKRAIDALQQWNGAGKEEDDKCRCVQPNWNAFTGKCLTCGKS